MRSTQLGGASGEWSHRLLRFHLPIAVASAVSLALFMTLPPFDPQRYVGMDMGSSNAAPRPMDMESAPPEPRSDGGIAAHGGAASQPPTGHGGGQTPRPSGHGGEAAPSAGHGSLQTGVPSAHGGEPSAPSAGDAPTDPRARRRFDQRLTIATGYVATALLALTLLVGPANLLLRRRTPVSSYLRRDAGMWTAGFSVVHVIVGLQVHSGGELSGMLGYFFGRDGSVLVSSFGLANWTGLGATVIVAGLLTISSDLALRTLKSPTWKWLQRLNYALFALVVAHAIFYGALLRATSPFTLLLALSVAAVLLGQVMGIWLWRRRHRASTVIAAEA